MYFPKHVWRFMRRNKLFIIHLSLLLRIQLLSAGLWPSIINIMIPPAPLFVPEQAPPGFFINVEKRLGRRWRKSFHDFEELHFDLAVARGHVNFIRRCIHFELIPKTFRRTICPINERERRKIQHQIMERMKIHLDSHISNCFQLERDINRMQQIFDRRLRFGWRKPLYNLCLHRLKLATEDQEKRKGKKFTNLLLMKGTCFINKRKGRDLNFELDEKKVVIDYCTVPLTDPERSVLALGSKFAVAPKKLPFHDLLLPVLAASDIVEKSGLPDCASNAAELRKKAVHILENARPPKPNLTPIQYTALKSLREDENRLFIPADKGNTIVAMDRKMYEQSVAEIVHSDDYELLRNNPTTSFSDKFLKILRKLFVRNRKVQEDLVSPKEYWKIHTSEGAIPCFYGLPKTHKDRIPPPLRPIVPQIDAFDETLQKHLSRILKPLMGADGVKNDRDFLQKLRTVKLEKNDILVSFDVVSMFTNIDSEKACDLVHQRLRADDTLHERTSLKPDQICQLLRFSMQHTAFKAGEEHYKQKRGTAMGKSFSPVIAEIYMQEFEEKTLSTAALKPKFWVRYVDDTFVVWSFGADTIPGFLHHLNSSPGWENIQFTVELEINGSISFLDMWITRKENSFETTVYRKPTNSGLFLKKNSLHHPSQKLSAISALAHRAFEVCSTEKERKKEIDIIWAHFRANGFSDWDIQKGVNAVRKAPGDMEESKHKPNVVCIPYLGKSYHQLARLMRKFNIQAIPTPHRTLRRLVSKPKSIVENKEKKNIVYQIDCSCGEIYIGQSKRTAGTRWKEHEKQWKDGVLKKKEITEAGNSWTERMEENLKSSFKKHLDHHPEFVHGQVLETFRSEQKRCLSEAIWIRRASLQGAGTILNSNSGRELDRIYDRIIAHLPKLNLNDFNNSSISQTDG